MGNAGICDLRGRCADCSLGMQDTFGGFRQFKGRTTSMYKIENIKIKMCNKAKVQENSQSIEFLLILLVRGNKTIFDWRAAIFSSKKPLVDSFVLFATIFYSMPISMSLHFHFSTLDYHFDQMDIFEEQSKDIHNSLFCTVFSWSIVSR